MINLAMPAVPSYAVRDMALGLGQYEPDLFLIYAGHNEFYGALGVGSSESIGTSRTLVRLILWLNHFRTFQLVADAVRGVRARPPGPAGAGPSRSFEPMERLAGERAIAHGSPLFHLAGDVFEANLQDVIDFARSHDAPVLIGTLVSNLRDQAPFVDVHRHPERKQAWQARLREAEAFWAGGDRGAALTAIDATIALDPLPASQYFLKGRILAAAGEWREAYAAFLQAKEMDGLRFRASEAINRRIERLAEAGGAALVPVRDAFEAQSEGRIPGASLFWEHLHPNLDGYGLIAKTFARVIGDQGILGNPAVASVPDEVWRRKSPVTDLDLEVARLRIEALKSGWPFTDETPVSPAAFLAARALDEDTSPIERLTLLLFNADLNWEDAHRAAAEHYRDTGAWAKAAEEYRALIHQSPMNESPYHFLAEALVEQERFDDALAVYLALAERSPGAGTDKMIGLLYIQQGDADRGIHYLESSLQADPDDTEARFNLARGHMMRGDLQAAYRAVRRVLRYDPDYPRARQVAAYLAEQLGSR